MLDTVIPDRAQYDLIAGVLAPRPLSVVVLAPGIRACVGRNRTRDPADRFDFDGYESLRDRMHGALDGVVWWFDTASLTPGATADRVAEWISTDDKSAWTTAVDVDG